MSPASRDQIRAGVAFVEANWVTSPTAAREYVRVASAQARQKLASAPEGRGLQVAVSAALSALAAAEALAELELGAAGVSGVADSQPTLLAQVEAFRRAA